MWRRIFGRDSELKKIKSELDKVKAERNSFSREIEELKKEKKIPKLGLKVVPEDIIECLQKSLEHAYDRARRANLETTFVVSDLRLQLKSIPTFEENTLKLILPKEAREIEPEEMSTVEINIKPIPGKRALFPEVEKST